MESLKDLVERQQNSRVPHDDPLVEKLFAELLALAEENCVLRDRLDTVDQLVSRDSVPTHDAINTWQPGDADIEERLAHHRRYFGELFDRLSS